jgi:hypothetical protein
MSWLTKALRNLTLFFSRLWDDVEPKIKNAFEDFAEKFADVALEEISRQALLTISGQQKLNDAADAVMERAKAAGWTLLRTAAVTLVQDVYTAHKAKLGPLVAPPGDEDAAARIEGRVQNPSPDR